VERFSLVSFNRGLDVLTPREREVFTSIARGATNGEPAGFRPSTATVKASWLGSVPRRPP
jgi:FixJ family two-component response regulator